MPSTVGYLWMAEEELGSGDFIGVRVVGEHMAAGRILTGDIVVVRGQPAVENGKLALVLLPGLQEAVIRFVHYLNGWIILHSGNPLHPPMICERGERSPSRY